MHNIQRHVSSRWANVPRVGKWKTGGAFPGDERVSIKCAMWELLQDCLFVELVSKHLAFSSDVKEAMERVPCF